MSKTAWPICHACSGPGDTELSGMRICSTVTRYCIRIQIVPAVGKLQLLLQPLARDRRGLGAAKESKKSEGGWFFVALLAKY